MCVKTNCGRGKSVREGTAKKIANRLHGIVENNQGKGVNGGAFSSWPDISISSSCILRPGLLSIYNLKWVALLLSRVQLARDAVESRTSLGWGRYVPYRRKRGADRIPLILIGLNRHIHIANVRPPIDWIEGRSSLRLTLIVIVRRRITVPRRSNVACVCLRRTWDDVWCAVHTTSSVVPSGCPYIGHDRVSSSVVVIFICQDRLWLVGVR